MTEEQLMEQNDLISIDDCVIRESEVILPRLIVLTNLPAFSDHERYSCDHDHYICDSGEVYLDCEYRVVFVNPNCRKTFMHEVCFGLKARTFQHINGGGIREHLGEMVAWVNEMASLYGVEHFPTIAEYEARFHQVWGSQ